MYSTFQYTPFPYSTPQCQHEPGYPYQCTPLLVPLVNFSTPCTPSQTLWPHVHTPVWPHTPTLTPLQPLVIPHDPSQTPAWPPEQRLPPIEPVIVCPPPVLVSPIPHIPPLLNEWESGTFPAQRIGSDVPIRIHPRLVFNPLDPNEPVLQWDVIQHPEIARVVSGRRILLPVPLLESAFTPKADRVYITSDQPYLNYWMEHWGPIIIEKPDITVRDILDAIYWYFQTPISGEEKRKIKTVESNASALRNAKRHRVDQSFGSLPALTANYGYLRSDVLGGLRRFQGLRATVFEDGSWKLYMGLLPGIAPNIFL